MRDQVGVGHQVGVQKSISRRTLLKAVSGAVLSAQFLRGQQSQPPNIILILCDDLGYGDLHIYGSNMLTPNLDRMAQEGVMFRQFYSTSDVCSPARASLMTGRYATRVGIPRVLNPTDAGLPLGEKTMAEVLKPAGYKTACVGKWHLGAQNQFLPTNRGFDSYFGIPYSNDQLPSILLQGTQVVESPVQLDTITQRYTSHAVDFINASKSSPFFLYFAHTFPHIPLAASAAFLGKSALGLYGDVLSEIDWSVGQVLQALQANGIDNNTLVMFTSDNGPWYLGSPGRLRGRKGSSYEGGVREPFIARFPGRIPAANGRSGSLLPSTSGMVGVGPAPARVSNAVATTLDIMPTVANLCGAALPANPMDGVDIWPVLSGQKTNVTRQAFLYFDDWNLQCARVGAWKVHVARYNTFPFSPDPVGGRVNLPLPTPELYNIEADPDESYDVAAEHPDIVTSMVALILKLLPTFPADVMNAWNATMSQKASANEGGLPTAIVPSN